MEFHEVVANPSANRQLEDMLKLGLRRISWAFELDLHVRLDSSRLDHSAIAMSVLNGSTMQAAFFMDEHIVKDELLYKRKYWQASAEKAPPLTSPIVYEEGGWCA